MSGQITEVARLSLLGESIVGKVVPRKIWQMLLDYNIKYGSGSCLSNMYDMLADYEIILREYEKHSTANMSYSFNWDFRQCTTYINEDVNTHYGQYIEVVVNFEDKVITVREVNL